MKDLRGRLARLENLPRRKPPEPGREPEHDLTVEGFRALPLSEQIRVCLREVQEPLRTEAERAFRELPLHERLRRAPS